jgi:hypothetical protein
VAGSYPAGLKTICQAQPLVKSIDENKKICKWGEERTTDGLTEKIIR